MKNGALAFAILLLGCGGQGIDPLDPVGDAAPCSSATGACDAAADARRDDGGDGGDVRDGGGVRDATVLDAATCPSEAPGVGGSCQPAAAPCVYDPSCPPGTGPQRKLSFVCTGGKWVDTLGPSPACEGPGPDTREKGCTDTGGKVIEQTCCTSADFPNTCLVGACSCGPSSSVEVRGCACPSGTCFNGSKCL